jgi:P-type E1-E2 ATPase
VEPAVIFSILILNAVVAIYQDLDAERAIEALQEIQSVHAIVTRSGQKIKIPAHDLVPGDIVLIEQGDKVPADLRILELLTITIKINQSILTGEANPVNKDTEEI